jgi:hypothetical protein
MDNGIEFARAIEKCLCRLTGLNVDGELLWTHSGFEGYPEEQIRVTGATPNDHTAF